MHIVLSQTALIDCIINQFGQANAHSVKTPIISGLQILHPNTSTPIPANVSTWMKHTPYHSLIDSLNYLAVVTRLDISFTIRCLASVLDCYWPEHWNATIHVV